MGGCCSGGSGVGCRVGTQSLDAAWADKVGVPVRVGTGPEFEARARPGPVTLGPGPARPVWKTKILGPGPARPVLDENARLFFENSKNARMFRKIQNDLSFRAVARNF